VFKFLDKKIQEKWKIPPKNMERTLQKQMIPSVKGINLHPQTVKEFFWQIGGIEHISRPSAFCATMQRN
jgi:hypothetical protein